MILVQEIILNLNNIFNILLIITFGILSVFFLKKVFQLEAQPRRFFFLGVFGFMLGWSIMNLLFLFGYAYPDTHPIFSTIWKIATVVGMSALFSLLLVIEKFAVTNSKFIFTIITFVGIMLIIFLPVTGTEISGARLVSYIFIPIGAMSIIVLDVYLVMKFEGRSRREMLCVLIGCILIFFGYVLDTELLSHLMPTPLDIIDSLLMIGGGSLITFIYSRSG